MMKKYVLFCPFDNETINEYVNYRLSIAGGQMRLEHLEFYVERKFNYVGTKILNKKERKSIGINKVYKLENGIVSL